MKARYPTDPYDNSHYIDYNALFPDYHPEEYENPWDSKDHKEEEEAEEEQENSRS